jgi:predicted nuclease of predicted toxin-antitoxin system
VRFLLNLNLPRVLGRRLVAAGHPCRHLGDIGLGRASDVETMAEAGKNHETTLNHHLDYGHLLAFSGETAPSLIIFRRRNPHLVKLLSRMLAAWPEMEPN